MYWTRDTTTSLLFLVFSFTFIYSVRAHQELKNQLIPEFRVYEGSNVQEGLPCVIIRMEAKITIQPNRLVNKKTTIDLPISANAKGGCGSRISLYWSSVHFNWHFQNSGDWYHVDLIEMSYNTSDTILGDDFVAPSERNSIVSVRTEYPTTFFHTPVRRSYSCGKPAEIIMLDRKGSTRVSIQLQNVRIQPFAAMTQRKFGDAFDCPISIPSKAGRKDPDTVSFAIGIVLAFVGHCTVRFLLNPIGFF